jgi:hypothetical protein
MMHLYGAIGITRQGFHKRLDRHLRFMDEAQQVRRLIGQIRLDHPELGARTALFHDKTWIHGTRQVRGVLL